MQRKMYVATALLLFVCLSGTPASADETVLIPGRVVMPDGSLQSDQAVVIEGGKIARIAPASEFENQEGARIRRYPDAVISPGLIDVMSALGVSGDNRSNAAPIDPSVAVIDALDRDAIDLRRALEAGVTATLVAPLPTNLVAGRCAVVRTGAAETAERVLVSFGPVLVVLSEGAWTQAREPSSRSGALGLLRKTLRAAAGGGDAPLSDVVSGNRRAIVYCDTSSDVLSALLLLGEYGQTPIIAHTTDVIDVAQDLSNANAPLIFGPLSFNSSDAVLLGPASVVDAGGQVVFSGGPGGDADRLRISAVLAVRNGVDANTARAALTSVAAEVVGVADRVGSIARGHDADLVVFSGDPLRLDSSVMEVWVAGERLYSAANKRVDVETVIGASNE